MSKKHLAICLSALGMAFMSHSANAALLYSGKFAKKVTVTFTGVQSGVSLTDFPALVKLSTAIDGFDYADFKVANGGDLRFADAAGNLIPHEVDSWDPSGVSTVWVKVPSLTQGATVTAYYGSTAELPEVKASDVWDDGYVGVWHLGESALPLKDSTGVSTSFTSKTGTVVYASAGAAGGAVDFSSGTSNNYLVAPDNDNLDGFGSFTLEIWTYQDAFRTDSSYAGIFSKRSGVNSQESFLVYQNNSNTNPKPFFNYNTDSTADGRVSLSASQLPATGQWTHQAFTRNMDADSLVLYVNGAVGSVIAKAGTANVYAGTAAMYLGCDRSQKSFPGKIDELRLSKVARSVEWLKATHDTVMASGFATYEVDSAVKIDESAFSRKIDVTFSGYTGDALENFPVLVKLSAGIPGFKYSDFALHGGGDIRFVDADGNLLPHEIDTWDESGVSTVWVKVPSLSPSAKIRALYGCTTPPPVDPNDVWDSNYLGVWHLGAAAGGKVEPDSTVNAHSFSIHTNNSDGVSCGANGVVGLAAATGLRSDGKGTFNYSDQGCFFSAHTAFTVEAWTWQDNHNPAASGRSRYILAQSGQNETSYDWRLYETATGKMAFQLDGIGGGNEIVAADSAAVPARNAWNHTAVVWNGSGDVGIYLGGESLELSASTKAQSWAGTMTGTRQDFNLGNHRFDNTNSFSGSIDEVRISKTVRSAAWIKATHDTVAASNFATYEVLDYDPDEDRWYTNGVIACSVPDFTLEPGSSYVYAFTTNCVVMALTNLHLTAVSQSVAGEQDYGYFLPGETKDIVASSGAMLGLTATPVSLSAIPSAAVTPSGAYTESREGVYTVYTFTGSGSITVDKPGVADVVIVGPNGGETVTLSRVILNEAATVVIDDTVAGFGRYLVGAGSGEPMAGSVTVRVWEEYVLMEYFAGPSKATLMWGVMSIEDTANIRLQYGTSRTALTNIVMLASGASAGASGLADVTGLDPDKTYYAQLQLDEGSGYAFIGDMVEFATEALLPKSTGGKEIFIGEPPVPGLKAGYANENNIDIATTSANINWQQGRVMGPIAATNKASETSSSAYPPLWANNRTWVYAGYMYFDGDHYYQFGELIDDYTKVVIDGEQKMKDTSWNTWGKVCVKPTEGWHSVEFRFSNGTGGAGIAGAVSSGSLNDFTYDKNGRYCGFGWAQVSSNVNPTNMKTLEWLCDPGDGSLLRAELPREFNVSINGFEVDVTQYNVTISNMTKSACSGTLYYGTGTDVDSITNSPMKLSEPLSIQPWQTVTLALEWEEGQPPNYVIDVPGIGISGVMSFTASSLVAASVKSVGSDSAVITVALGFDIEVEGDVPTSTLEAYFGPADAGAGESGWARTQALGSVEAGMYDFTVTGLEVGESYVLRIKATDQGGNVVWSSPVSFSVSGVYLGGGIEVYENDPRQQKVLLNRAGAASDLAVAKTVFLEYSGNGLGSVSELPGQVTFEPGANTAYVAFTVTDNIRTDGNRSFDISIMEGSSYVAIAPLSATVTILDDESAEGEVVTWTGGATGNNWADEDNWDPRHVPRSVDTARFADTGVTAGMTVNVAAAEGMRQLLIETPLAIAFSGTGSLAVNRLVRTDSAGVEEGLVSVNVPVVAGNWENGYSRWAIAGSAGVELNAGLSAPEGIMLLKEGAGGLWLASADTTYRGPWYIGEGTVYAAAENAIRGDLTIGAGDGPARLEALVDNAIGADSAPNVWTNGTFVARESADATIQPMRVNVYSGGVANLGEHFSGHQAYFEGGTINGQMISYGPSDQRIVTSPSSETATFNCEYVICAESTPLDITVVDGAAPVDLVLGQRITYGADSLSGQYLTKFGSGTMRTLADWTGMSLGVEIAAGRVLVDNPSADGLGNQAVKVDAGASLGGTGFIGGTSASYATSSAVTVEGQGNNEGKIEPGTLDEDGNHVIGTLTVGSAAKNGSVSFGNFTQLTVHVGPNGKCDRLLVNGPVSIAPGVGTKIAIVCDDAAAVGGKYVVLRATGGLSGTFYNVVAPLPGWKVTYTATEIAVEAPQPGRRVIIR